VLWIALHLPLLSLESFAATLAKGERPAGEVATPLALMDAHRIVSANGAAQALGVKAGLKRATALALAPQLLLGRADRARDEQALEPVAHAALAFTPSVAIQPADSPDAAPHTVLLEVGASLRYFGGRNQPAAAPAGGIAAAEPPDPQRPARRRRTARHCSPACTASCTAPTSRRPARPSRARRSGCSGRGASTGTRCRAWACRRWAICAACRGPVWHGASAKAC
jgi:protein ImuB